MTAPTILILAAGRGDRFRAAGGPGHKLAAPLAGKSVLEHTLAAARASGLPVHVVSTPTPGMGWSIAAGVRATAKAPGWLILPGDMPLVAPDTIRRVAAALSEALVVLPLYQETRAHPVGFGPPCRDALLGLTGDVGARSVIALFPFLELTVDDPGCVLDVDTPADLAHVRKRLSNIGKQNSDKTSPP